VRRKILQDYANTLCQMLVGWRMGDDLEVLASLPDGTLHIDAMSGAATHSINGLLNLHVAGELQSWLQHRMSEKNIEPSAISSAIVRANIRTDRIATNRKRIVSFDFEVTSSIVTSEREYKGALIEVHQWHTRAPSNNSLKSDAAEPRSLG
jgi:hypothetical protein